jgi:glycine betaine/proline transport system ATP-binding protein
MGTREPTIHVQHLTKVFGHRHQEALNLLRSGKSKAEIERLAGATVGVLDANFEVGRGEIFVIIGLSGSGKSTLLRCINRLIEPTTGDVYVDGECITRMSPKQLREVRRKKIGMVFQHFGLLPHRTVLDNITFGLEIQGLPAKERRGRGEEMLQIVGLAGQGKKRVSELSGGMQQRVGLARALASNQEVLLMDEPFSALDPLIRRDMQNFLLELQVAFNRTILFVTHDIDEALRLGHRVAIMQHGVIVQLGNPEDILTCPATEYVQRFVADVDRAKVRHAESVMIPPREIAYESEGPQVVMLRMKKAGLSTIFVVNKERRLVGIADIDAIAQLAERKVAEIRQAVDRSLRSVQPNTYLRDILPLFIDSHLPVAVVDENERLAGVITRGSLIAGLAATWKVDVERETRELLSAANPPIQEVLPS